MHRKVLRILGAALLTASLMSVPARAETAFVTGSDVNLREGPGTNYRILDCLPWGASVTVTDRSDDTWYAVEVDGQTGFMSAQFLNIEDEQQQAAETPPPAEEGDPAWVNAMYVRFRSGPGSDYSVLGEYNRGKTLTVYGYSGAWASCSIDGRSGYIYADYLAFGVPENAGQQAPSPTPAPTPSPAQEDPDDDVPAWVREQEETPPAQTPTPTAVPVQAPAPAAQAAAPVSQVIGEGYINGNYVRFRTGPGTNYQIIDAYDYGQALEIVGESDGWTACLIDGQFGYVHGAYVEITSTHEATAPQPTGSSYTEAGSTPQPTPEPTPAPPSQTAAENKEGYVAGNNVRMRDGASMSAGIITELFYGNRVTITGSFGDWTAVYYEGKPGYIYSQFVKEGSLSIAGSSVTGSAYAVPGSDEAPGQTPELSGSSYEKGQQIAQYALQFLGYNYCWGGKDPSTGFDCSGLVYYVYGQFGYTLNRVAQDQARNGTAVSADSLQPGDI
ncbi:MAG: SH3 domain-containing protein, partial [Eubacteriales bacterium]|nr:SH3 domain-containing protein [Eubacteriales bacterium]